MSSSRSIADAAQLAAQAPPGGILPPRDEQIERAYLDLRDDRLTVARSRLVAVAKAFGPRLQIQADLRLLIATGELSPTEAALLFAQAAFPVGVEGGPLIAVVRGEEVLDQLETLVAEGGTMHNADGPCSLLEEKRPIIAARTPAPHRVIRSAFERSATIVVSRMAEAGSLTEDGPDENEVARVEVSLIDRYELVAMLRKPLSTFQLAPDMTARLTVATGDRSDAGYITATASRYDELVDLAQRVELAAGPGTFDIPLATLIQPRLANAWIDTPAALFEFDCDLRTAPDWAN